MAYFIADLSITYLRPHMLPSKPPPTRPSNDQRIAAKDMSEYSSITRKNIFNEDGKIPPALTGGGGEGDIIDADPVLTQLPIKLEGTLVHADPKKSIGTILLSSKNQTQSYMVDEDMENMGKIVRIERRKVIFRNSSNQRLEYVEIPKESALTFGPKTPTTSSASGGVQQKNEFEFTVSRSEIEKSLSNLGAILNQARMVPNIVPGTGGRVEGFRFVTIQPGSIYEKLGFKPMDVIKEVQGEAVNSPTKAMELYNALRTENNIKLKIDRNGRAETITFDVTK